MGIWITRTEAAAQGLTPRRVPVEALHAKLPADGSVASIWERVGWVNGDVHYTASAARATERGIEIVTGEYGTVTLIYPLGEGREVRTLARKSSA
jgi:hypothetical protein